MAYTNKFWPGLIVFLTDPLVPLSTNDVERSLRGPAVGRKNHYGSKSLGTAKIAAIWYSVIETCRRNGVNPSEYISKTIEAILTKQPYQMPWEWRNNPATTIIQ